MSYPEIPGFDLHAFMKFTSDPADTAAIFDVQKSMMTSPNRLQMIADVIKSIEASSTFMSLYRERYIPRFPTNEELTSQAPGTLGHAIGTHLTNNGIQLDFSGLDTSTFYPAELTSIAYLSIRGIRIHDIVHTVLGLGVSPLEEYCVASYTLAQFRSPYHMAIVSSGYIHTAFKEPEKISQFLDLTHRFYSLGLKSEFIHGYKFEDNLSKPLSTVRKELGLVDLVAMNGYSA